MAGSGPFFVELWKCMGFKTTGEKFCLRNNQAEQKVHATAPADADPLTLKEKTNNAQEAHTSCSVQAKRVKLPFPSKANCPYDLAHPADL